MSATRFPVVFTVTTSSKAIHRGVTTLMACKRGVMRFTISMVRSFIRRMQSTLDHMAGPHQQILTPRK